MRKVEQDQYFMFEVIRFTLRALFIKKGSHGSTAFILLLT